jgi:phenylacetic acid degradation operon negative regulatory protein
MRGSRLVQWCGLFGVAEGTTRVALSRMVERGELRARDGMYEPAGRVQSRKGAQDWSIDPVLSKWRGAWRFAVVVPGPRDPTARAALRDGMRRLRCAPLREGVWTRPDNLPRESAPAEAWKLVDAECQWWSGRPDDDPVALAARLFDIARWSQRAAMLTPRLTQASDALGDGDDRALADGFVTGAAVLAHMRADPLLPRELVVDADAGRELRRAYRTYEATFSRALRAWFLRH